MYFIYPNIKEVPLLIDVETELKNGNTLNLLNFKFEF